MSTKKALIKYKKKVTFSVAAITENGTEKFISQSSIV
jgi:hypothetical protein